MSEQCSSSTITSHIRSVLWIRISESAWIRIELALLDANPDPGARILTKLTNKPDILPFKKAFVSLRTVGMFYDLYLT